MTLSQRNSLIVSSLIIFIPWTIVIILGGGGTFDMLRSLIYMAIFLPLPLSDMGTVRYQTIPWVTITIIVINIILLFWWQGFADAIIQRDLQEFKMHYWIYGSRSRYLFEGYSIGTFTSITSVFMHINHEHLLGNMVFLWAFGRRLEDACGHGRYFIFYIIAGLVAGLGAVYLSPPHWTGLDVPGIGASGAVFGVMGAYLILFPTSRIQCFWIVGIIPIRPLIMFFAHSFEEDNYKQFRWLITLPSIFVIGLYAFFNFLDAFKVFGGEEVINAGGKLAHISGFLASILIFLFVRKDLLRRYIKGRNL